MPDYDDPVGLVGAVADDRLSNTAGDPAAWAPIHWIVGRLDKMLPALFFPDYDEGLQEARRRLRLIDDDSLGD